MWIFLNDAFLSIVAHVEKPDYLHVRGRLRGDIERVFPDAAVTETPDGDYLFRADVLRIDAARALADRTASIAYENFKGSVAPDDQARHRTYLEVWTVMDRYQRRGASGAP